MGQSDSLNDKNVLDEVSYEEEQALKKSPEEVHFHVSVAYVIGAPNVDT